MEWVETTGKTIEAAKDAALDQLGVDEQDAEFEVVEEPRTGLFGRTRGEARVRARVAPLVQRPKQERRRGGKSSGGSSTAKRSGGRGGSSGGRPRSDRPASADAPAAGAESPASKGPKEPRAPREPRPAQQSKQRSTRAPRDESAPAGEGKASMEDSVTVEAQSEIMEEFLEGLLDAFGLDGEVSSHKVDDDTMEIEVTGDDLGLLIGPKGLTLQAVQDLARTVVQRRAAGHHEGRVRVDVGGYRQRRREALARFATQVAEQVLSSGEPKALEPMGAADRKIVHDTVNEIDGVETRSDGQDPDRWVVILPSDG